MTARKPKGKREPKPAAKRTAKATSRYDELAAQWKNDPDRGSGNWLVDKPELPMDAMPFLVTLRRLRTVKQDKRYTDLHHELLHSDLIDAKGKWSRWSVLAQPDTQLLCERIRENIAAGVPEREVLAEAVVEFNIEAATFDAAVQTVRRLFHRHLKSV